ncbi:MAG TPA: hypothetical protein VF020_01165 [Chthoniobacterales bacterium]
MQHFSRVFKGVTGQSPINFRRRCVDRDSRLNQKETNNREWTRMNANKR